jgi:dephospho-CoA kinase
MPYNKHKLVVGLTGGIGSGKSTIANLFAAHGVAIIDTDILARELTQPAKPAFNAIIEQFGSEILLANEQLNRKALREIVFADPAKRLWLEKCLHPLIREEIAHRITSVKSVYCIVVIPLLFETTPNPLIDRVLVADTTEELQIQRAMTRDKLSLRDIRAIMETQITREQRLASADDIISNISTIEDLIPQVAELHKFYLSYIP